MKNRNNITILTHFLRIGSVALTFLLSTSPAFGQKLELSAESMQRADLPEGFPFQVLHEGFAILRVTVENRSDVEMPVDLTEIEIRAPRGKKLKRVEPTDIAPKLMKYYRGGSARVLGEAHVGRRPTGPELQRAPTAGAPGRAGHIDVSTGARLREVLEFQELPESPLAPGESTTGFIYIRSKKSGTHLEGGTVQLGATETTID